MKVATRAEESLLFRNVVILEQRGASMLKMGKGSFSRCLINFSTFYLIRCSSVSVHPQPEFTVML